MPLFKPKKRKGNIPVLYFRHYRKGREERDGRRSVHKKNLVHASILIALALLSVITIARFSFFGNSTINASAIETTEGIGVYWDASCTRRVYSIDWGVLSLGETKKVVAYVRNEGIESSFLYLIATNWNPRNSHLYLSFSWSRIDNRVATGEVVEVTQNLRALPYVSGISSFSFDIIFEMRKYLLGDVNMNGVVDLIDVLIVCSLFRLNPEDPQWKAAADLNRDLIIDLRDVMLVIRDLWKSS